jgi:hypothetical protein
MTGERWEERSIEVVELQRARWCRAREQRGMTSVLDQPFAGRGLAIRLEDLSVRFLIMPSDPDAFQIRFTDDFWEWWRSPTKDPFRDSTT